MNHCIGIRILPHPLVKLDDLVAQNWFESGPISHHCVLHLWANHDDIPTVNDKGCCHPFVFEKPAALSAMHEYSINLTGDMWDNRKSKIFFISK